MKFACSIRFRKELGTGNTADGEKPRRHRTMLIVLILLAIAAISAMAASWLLPVNRPGNSKPQSVASPEPPLPPTGHAPADAA
jgi:flagellar basal body-associated protein FliL